MNESAIQIAKNIREKKISSFEITSAFLERIEKLDSQINSVITLNEQALSTARNVEKNGSEKPLAGVPILFKDMFCTKGLKTTAASKMLENFIPPYSATVVEKLIQAGAVVLGKCNQDEFAMGHSTKTSYFGLAKNPWNLDYTPGGSSGGSAAAVSAGFAPVSLGTDTGGSIRQPAHFCNLVGVKPTYGRVSRFGIVAYASSMDQAGPMTRTVEDSALILYLMSGKDEKDSTTSSTPVPPWHENLNADVMNLKVGIPQEFLKNISPSVQKSLKLAQDVLRKNGAKISEISLSLSSYFAHTYYLISSCEASSNLSRYDGIRYGFSKPSQSLTDLYSQTRGEGFGSEVKRRILMGTFCLSEGYYEAYFKKAQKVRRLIQDQFKQLFKEVDVILTPVTPGLPPPLEESSEDLIKNYTGDMFTVPANLSGLPGLSVPVGVFDGFPLGVQLMGRAFDEQTLFNTAYLLQEELKAYKNKPSFGEN